MANFAGYKPLPIARWGSQVEWDDPTELPLGVLSIARNCRYTAQAIGTRFGVKRTIIAGANPLTGLALAKYTGAVPGKFTLFFDSAADLWRENAHGSGNKTAIADALGLLFAGQNAQIETAYDRAWFAFSDLLAGTKKPAVLNLGTLLLDPISDKPVGVTWSANTVYRAGHVVTPTVANGHSYRSPGGTSGAVEPVWPLTDGGTIADNGMLWVEKTPKIAVVLPAQGAPTLTRNAGAGNFAAARDVFVKLMLVNENGSTDITLATAAMLANTVLNDAVTVTSPTMPAWITALVSPYAAIGYDIYEADTPTGTATSDNAFTKSNQWTVEIIANSGATRAANVATIKTTINHQITVGAKVTVVVTSDATFNVVRATVTAVTANTFSYANVGANVGAATAGGGTATAPIPFGTNYQIRLAATGVAAPTANTAYITPAGNVCGGVRWMMVLYLNRNGYICGISDAMPVGMISAADGRQVYVADVPIGPANTAKRVCAFTEADDAKAGRYFYIPTDDFVSAADINAGLTGTGIRMTATIIGDNVTTAATFNFLDEYLADAEEVSDFFRKIEVPECVDIFHSTALNRMVYTGISGYPSSCFVSPESDGETINLPGSEVIVAEKDGDRVVCWREFNETQYALKENSGHVVIPTDPAAEKWNVRKLWDGSGPAGPRAVDVCTKFMIYVHQTGLWKYEGGKPPEMISLEMSTTWARVNWEAKETIWVKIDECNARILIGLPLDDAVVPSHQLSMSYLMGWDDPVIFSVRAGKLIPNVNGRKWSLDNIPANLAVLADRDLVVSVDAEIDHRQVLYAGQDGVVRMEVPDFYSDEDVDGNKVGIDWQVETVYAPNPTIAVLELGGVSVSAKGNGTIDIFAVLDKVDGAGIQQVVPITTAVRPFVLAGGNEGQYDSGARIQNEWIALKFDNGAVADVWAELHAMDMFMRVKWPSRKG